MELYGTLSELEEKGIDPTELLRLMKKEDEEEIEEDKNDEFAYSNSEEEEEIANGRATDCSLSSPEATSPTNPKSQVCIGEGAADASSIYSSAPSLLSVYSTVEAATSQHGDSEVMSVYAKTTGSVYKSMET